MRPRLTPSAPATAVRLCPTTRWLPVQANLSRKVSPTRACSTAALVSGAAYPLVASAQKPSKLPKLPTIGYLDGAESVESDWLAAFVRRFGELGWVEGRTVTIVVRWSPAARPRCPWMAPKLSVAAHHRAGRGECPGGSKMGGFQCQSVSVSKQCHARCSRIQCQSVPGETIGNCANTL